MKTTNIFLWLLFTAAVLTGCDNEMPDYYDSRTYDLENFDAVELGDALQVEIIQGTEYSVVAKGEAPDLADLQLRVENGVLTGHYRHGSRNHKRTKVVIFMPQLRVLKMGAASDTEVTGFNTPPETFFLQLSGASAVRMEANFKSLEVRIDGASELTLHGEGNVLDAVVGGASMFNARELTVTAVGVQVGGASEAIINVSNRLEGSVQGNSLLRYHGNPQMLDVYVAGDSQMSRF